MNTSNYLKNAFPLKIFTQGGLSKLHVPAPVYIHWQQITAGAHADTHSPVTQISHTQQLSGNTETYETPVWILCCQGGGSIAWKSGWSHAGHFSPGSLHNIRFSVLFSPSATSMDLVFLCLSGDFTQKLFLTHRETWNFGTKGF